MVQILFCGCHHVQQCLGTEDVVEVVNKRPTFYTSDPSRPASTYPEADRRSGGGRPVKISAKQRKNYSPAVRLITTSPVFFGGGSAETYSYFVQCTTFATFWKYILFFYFQNAIHGHCNLNVQWVFLLTSVLKNFFRLTFETSRSPPRRYMIYLFFPFFPFFVFLITSFLLSKVCNIWRVPVGQLRRCTWAGGWAASSGASYPTPTTAGPSTGSPTTTTTERKGRLSSLSFLFFVEITLL